MIESDGKPTIASKRIDPLLREALDKGGHLGDDVARVLLEEDLWLKSNQRAGNLQMPETTFELPVDLDAEFAKLLLERRR